MNIACHLEGWRLQQTIGKPWSMAITTAGSSLCVLPGELAWHVSALRPSSMPCIISYRLSAFASWMLMRALSWQSAARFSCYQPSPFIEEAGSSIGMRAPMKVRFGACCAGMEMKHLLQDCCLQKPLQGCITTFGSKLNITSGGLHAGGTHSIGTRRHTYLTHRAPRASMFPHIYRQPWHVTSIHCGRGGSLY